MPDGAGSDTRTKILEVAEREFAERGFAGTHLQGIAEQIGVQKTALYHYFASKEALYVAILHSMLETMDAAVVEALATRGSFAERFTSLLDAINGLLAERRHYAQILVRILVDRVLLEGQPLRPLIEQLVGRQLAFYKDGIEAGEFAKLSPRHIYQTVIGATFWHYATGAFGAAVLGVDDLFTHGAVRWRREEVRQQLLRAVLRDPPPVQP
jgi:AcrR family transcriptional regulator